MSPANWCASLCTLTLVNPWLDERVSAVREETTSCHQPDCVLGLCTPTLVNRLFDERVSAV